MEIEISGYKVLIDEEDYEQIMQHDWKLHKSIVEKHNRYYFYAKKSYGV